MLQFVSVSEVISFDEKLKFNSKFAIFEENFTFSSFQSIKVHAKYNKLQVFLVSDVEFDVSSI